MNWLVTCSNSLVSELSGTQLEGGHCCQGHNGQLSIIKIHFEKVLNGRLWSFNAIRCGGLETLSGAFIMWLWGGLLSETQLVGQYWAMLIEQSSMSTAHQPKVTKDIVLPIYVWITISCLIKICKPSILSKHLKGRFQGTCPQVTLFEPELLSLYALHCSAHMGRSAATT